MSAIVRMGARASLAEDQRPFVRSTTSYVDVDSRGDVIGRREIEDDADGLALAIAHFVDLADGRRLTTERYGAITLVVERDIARNDLDDEIRETIFDDEAREVDEELAAEPRWEDMAEILGEVGIRADDATLEALPFVVEVDDAVIAALASG
jgi:hypothetical protein